MSSKTLPQRSDAISALLAARLSRPGVPLPITLQRNGLGYVGHVERILDGKLEWEEEDYPALANTLGVSPEELIRAADRVVEHVGNTDTFRGALRDREAPDIDADRFLDQDSPRNQRG